jgi:hypothetical protein
MAGQMVAVAWLLAQLTNRRTTADDSKVSALKLLQHLRPVAPTVEESLFKELKCYGKSNFLGKRLSIE